MRDQRGQGIVEYVLIAILVALASILFIEKFGGSVRGRYRTASTTVDSAAATAAKEAAGGHQNEGPTELAEGGKSQEGQGGARGGSSALELNFSISFHTAIWLLILIVVFALLYVARMRKNIQKTQAKEKALLERRRRFERENGQAMLEFFIAVLIGLVMILGIFQLALIYNARSMVQLAAFNAARAAIVARSQSDPTSGGAVTLLQMKNRAKQAAFVTILPVIPALQGRFPLNPDPKKFAKLAETANGTDPATILPLVRDALGFGGGKSRIDAAVWEYGSQNCPDDNMNLIDCLDVRIIPANADPDTAAQTEANWPDIEFDDPSAASDQNLIRVVVTWQYPVVIPFINRIFTAIARPGLYTRASNAAGSNTDAATNAALQAIGTPTGQRSVNIWAQGFSFSKVTRGAISADPVNSGTLLPLFAGTQVINIPPQGGNEGATVPGETVFTQQASNTIIQQTLGEFLLFRVPVRASYIMRMQWDRSG